MVGGWPASWEGLCITILFSPAYCQPVSSHLLSLCRQEDGLLGKARTWPPIDDEVEAGEPGGRKVAAQIASQVHGSRVLKKGIKDNLLRLWGSFCRMNKEKRPERDRILCYQRRPNSRLPR